MAWITALDTRSQHWPAPQRWLYLGVKWGLVLLGAFALGGVLLDRFGMLSL